MPGRWAGGGNHPKAVFTGGGGAESQVSRRDAKRGWCRASAKRVSVVGEEGGGRTSQRGGRWRRRGGVHPRAVRKACGSLCAVHHAAACAATPAGIAGPVAARWRARAAANCWSTLGGGRASRKSGTGARAVPQAWPRAAPGAGGGGGFSLQWRRKRQGRSCALLAEGRARPAVCRSDQKANILRGAKQQHHGQRRQQRPHAVPSAGRTRAAPACRSVAEKM
jgi:hypothetical protein